MKPLLLPRAPRVGGGFGCTSIEEVDPFWNYDQTTDTFVISATSLVQRATSRDINEDPAANEHDTQWGNGSTVSDCSMLQAYKVPSDAILAMSYAHLVELLAHMANLGGKVRPPAQARERIGPCAACFCQ